MSRTPEKCPNCEEWLEWESVNVGVGIINGPAWCNNPDCGYNEDAGGLVEPDGRVPSKEVPNEHDLAKSWAEVPVASAPDTRSLEDDLHDAINPPSPGLNIGLARMGSRNQVGRIMDMLRQRGLLHG